MIASKQIRRSAKELFQLCLVDGLMDEDRIRKVVTEMTTRKPHGFLAILKQFHRLVRLALEGRSARVECAIALTEPQKQALSDRLTRLYGAGLVFQYELNPALLGGLKVRVGSDVLDGSLQSRLLRLEESF